VSTQLIDFALIPFFGGLAKDTNPHGDPDKKPQWLRDTVANIRQYAKHIEIGTCQPEDHELATSVGADGVVSLPYIDPLLLPARFLKYMQPHVSGIVMFTEADNALHFRKTPLAEHIRVIEEDHERYITPHVWNHMDQDKICIHGTYCCPHPDTGELWHISNTIPETLAHREAHRLGPYYNVPDTLGWQSIVESGGCTYICHSDLFKRLPCKDWTVDPLEYSAIIEIFWTGTCLKTYFFNDFLREHFSGGPPHVARCRPVAVSPQIIVKE